MRMASLALSNWLPRSVRYLPASTTALPVATAMPPTAAPTASALTLSPLILFVACWMALPSDGSMLPARLTTACKVLFAMCVTSSFWRVTFWRAL